MFRWASALIACLVLVMPVGVARAAPSASSVATVLSALKVQPEPADYVIIVDTSKSMAKENRYERVKVALASTLGTLLRADRVSLITFDREAKVRFRGPVGADPLAALDSLPPQPTGNRTDIGAGIEAGISELERIGAGRAGVIALITDGRVEVDSGTRYRTVQSPAWATLKQRADKVRAAHQIAPYALSLVSQADAALLKIPFPQADVMPAGELGARVGNLRSQLTSYQGAERLRPDLKSGAVTATWSGVDWATLTPGDHPATVRLTSSYGLLPVQATGLAVTSKGALQVGVTGLPAAVDLAPGATVSLPVTVRVAGDAGSVAAVTMAGSVTSPWQQVITRDLRMPFAPTLTAATVQAGTPPGAAAASSAPASSQPVVNQPVADAPASSQPVGMSQAPRTLPVQTILGAAAGLLLALGLALLVIRVRKPPLTGSIRITRSGSIVREFMLHGRSAALTGVEGLTGTVTADRTRNAEPRVRVAGNAGGTKQRGVLSDGETLEIGGLTVTYTAPRTRMISIIERPDAP